MSRLLSLRHWSLVFRRVFRLLLHPQVAWRDKLWFGAPALLYWILPDAIPYLPVDDIAVTMLLANWFAERMERKYEHLSLKE